MICSTNSVLKPNWGRSGSDCEFSFGELLISEIVDFRKNVSRKLQQQPQQSPLVSNRLSPHAVLAESSLDASINRCEKGNGTNRN